MALEDLGVATAEPPEDVKVKPAASAGEDLNDLARDADLLDTSPERDAQAGQVAETQALTASNEGELLMTLEMIRAMVFPLLGQVTPEDRMRQLGQVWNDGVLKASAVAGAAVMEKHGWSMGSVMGNYGCYVMLAAALAPPIIQTKQILSAPKPAEKKPVDGQQQ